MKTRVLKAFLPLFAMLLGVGLAFAAETKPVSQTAHYYNPNQGWESIMVDDSCFDGGVIACKFAGFQLYAERDFGSTALHKN